MSIKTIGIVLNGATSRICSTQHLENALLPIIKEGGLRVGETTILPQLLLVGRNQERLAAVAQRLGGLEWSTDLDAALHDTRFSIFFDAGVTNLRTQLLHRALAAGKHIYAEKPAVATVAEGAKLLEQAVKLKQKHGVVEDKLFLPGLRKLQDLNRSGFFGRIVSFRLEFGWWVFDGFDIECQRPSWNYRRALGGGLVSDMHTHWRYVLEGVLGPIERVVTAIGTAIPRRVDEAGLAYDVDVEDYSATLATLASGGFGTVISSWATRVRREELLEFRVDGTDGSAVAGLHRCHFQDKTQTPKVRWSPNEDQRANYFADWASVPDLTPFRNSYRAGWESYLSHVVLGTPHVADLSAGIRDVMLAEACYLSAAERRWVDLSPPESLSPPA